MQLSADSEHKKPCPLSEIFPGFGSFHPCKLNPELL